MNNVAVTGGKIKALTKFLISNWKNLLIQDLWSGEMVDVAVSGGEDWQGGKYKGKRRLIFVEVGTFLIIKKKLQKFVKLQKKILCRRYF